MTKIYYIGKIKVAETGYAFLLSDDGDRLFQPDQERVGKNYKEYSVNENKEKVFREEILAKNNGFVTYRGDEGIQWTAAYATIPSTGWKVVVTVPNKEIYTELDKVKFLKRKDELGLLAEVGINEVEIKVFVSFLLQSMGVEHQLSIDDKCII